MLHQCSCYNDVASSLLDENKKQDLIFHRTVLEGYWELEARTGTVEKLLVSTFVFWLGLSRHSFVTKNSKTL